MAVVDQNMPRILTRAIKEETFEACSIFETSAALVGHGNT